MDAESAARAATAVSIPPARNYALEAVESSRLRCAAAGSPLKRLGRCHPWHPGGFDPPPTGARRMMHNPRVFLWIALAFLLLAQLRGLGQGLRAARGDRRGAPAAGTPGAAPRATRSPRRFPRRRAPQPALPIRMRRRAARRRSGRGRATTAGATAAAAARRERPFTSARTCWISTSALTGGTLERADLLRYPKVKGGKPSRCG